MCTLHGSAVGLDQGARKFSELRRIWLQFGYDTLSCDAALHTTPREAGVPCKLVVVSRARWKFRLNSSHAVLCTVCRP